jgi:hypothetical protein
MHPSKGNEVFGEPEKWEFDYSWDVLQTAFWLFSISDFKRLPTQDEVLSYDPRYISDIKLMYWLYSYQGNQSAVMKMFTELEAKQNLANSINSEITN